MKQPVHLISSGGVERWSEYFQKLLHVPGDIEPEELENIEQRSVNTVLDEKPTIYEIV